MQVANNRRGRAEKVLKDAWQAHPHPMLANAYKGVVNTVTADKQLNLARSFVAMNPSAADSHILVARFAMAAERWADAENALAPLTRRSPSVRVCYLMAEIEADGRNNRDAARDWLARAADAPPDEAWVCTETGAVQAEWSAVCQASQLFGTLDWRVPHHLEQHAPVVLGNRGAAGRSVAMASGGDSSAASAVVEAVAERVTHAKDRKETEA